MGIKYEKFLTVFLVFILLGGAYLYFSRDLDYGKIIPVAFGSSLSSSSTNEGVPSSASDKRGDKVTSDVSFLTTLISLKTINIDTSLFSNKFFNALKNNTVKIESVVPGRPNPFAPIESQNSVNVPAPGVVTEEPTQITDKTVVLNGTINITGAKDAYFEYGTNEVTLTSVTTMVKQSLVGTFIKNVSGLTPKTNYFFRACAKVNNTPLCGKVVSFTTN